MSNSIGIYMPAFNVGKYIKKSINSILRQTFVNWELVIIDDCSDDDTFVKAKEINDTRISVYKRDYHNGRIGKIKNEAISLLNGNHKYICHIGSDDYITENCFDIYVKYMDKNQDIGVCVGNFKCFNNQGQEWTLPHVSNSGEFCSDTLLRYNNAFPLRFYKKVIVDEIGGYDNDLTSAVDYDLILRLDEVTKIHRIKDPIMYYYRQHRSQVSTMSRPEQNLNAKKALQKALDRRGTGEVLNDYPPFKIRYKKEEHFIWGKE